MMILKFGKKDITPYTYNIHWINSDQNTSIHSHCGQGK